MRRRFRLIAVLSATCAIIVAGVLILDGSAARARIPLVQAMVDRAIDAERTIGDLLGGHPRAPPARWDTGWGADEQLVSAVIALPRLDALPADLAAPLRGQVARTPAWLGIADDRPVALRIVFRVTPESEVEPVAVFAEHAWVVYRPERVAAFEEALAQADANAGQRAAARRHRLVHDDDRALFDAGLEGLALAAPGLDPTARIWLAVFARWR